MDVIKGGLIGAGLTSALCLALTCRSRNESRNASVRNGEATDPFSNTVPGTRTVVGAIETRAVRRPFVIAFGGPSGSGKTTFCQNLHASLRKYGVNASIISCDSYYRTMPHGEDPAKYNFDEPVAIERSLLASHLSDLKTGKAANVPEYCFKT